MLSSPDVRGRNGQPIDTAVFDFGGVLLDWNPRHLYERLIEDPVQLDRFLSDVCPHSWHLQHDRGVPFAETLPVRKTEFPDDAELIDAWGQRYGEMIGGDVPGTAAVLDELRAGGTRLLGLTNLPAEVWPQLRVEWPVTAGLDGVLVSGEEGMVKPEPAIFELLIERFGLNPARTVFIDDVELNVTAARAQGLRAVRFTDADTLRSELRALGLPIAPADQ